VSTCWTTVERPTPGGGIDSVQRVGLQGPAVPMRPDGARELCASYWAEVERSSRGLVRIRHDRGGVVLALLGLLALFRFGSGTVTCDVTEVECRFPIHGGLLVSRPGGSLAVVQRSVPVLELELEVTGYHPGFGARLLAPASRLFYTRVQRPLHLAVSRRFLLGLSGKLP
jgi:hypothetical protein